MAAVVCMIEYVWYWPETDEIIVTEEGTLQAVAFIMGHATGLCEYLGEL